MPDLDTVRTFLDDSHVELAASVRAFADAHLRPLEHAHDDAAAREQARHVMKLFGEHGVLDVAFPVDLRGCCLTRETVAAASTLADDVFALQALGTLPIQLGGTDALRSAYAEPARRGELMAGFAMTEPNAGSDVAAMETRAERRGDEWVLTGDKTLISNAGIADFYCTFAKTNPEAGSRGISCFLVPADAPGLEFAGAQVLSAPHPLGALRFDGCRVPATHLLGEENAGFKLGMRTLDSLRVTVAAAACGMAERALDEALDHVTTREQFGAPLAELQMVQNRLARMATELAASRLLVYRAAADRDRGVERPDLQSAMAKSYATEAAQRIIDDAVQLIGGKGVLASHPVDQLYRAIRPLRIYEGATDVQHVVIARALLRRHLQRGK